MEKLTSFEEFLNGPVNESKINEGIDEHELSKYVKSASDKTFKGGGNGQNLLDNALALADFIDSYRKGRNTRGYEEDGFYEVGTVDLFKKLVDQMSKDDMKNNKED
jgi:hypothetical protein